VTESDAFLGCLAPLLLIVGCVDTRSGRVPNAAIALLGIGAHWREAPELLPERLVGAAILAAPLLLLRAFCRRRHRHAGLGLGDVKFLAAATF
jgi:leader peptidase (prepilin peptidase) / N-methyltransferase